MFSQNSRRFAFLLVVATTLVAQERAQTTREFLGLGPAPDATAAKAGEPLYKENCSTCHGPTARGAQGPNLVRSVVVLHDAKGEGISEVIRQGRPSAGMPAFTSLTTEQIYEIAEYLHLQVELTANRGTYRQTYSELRNRATGDAVKGKQFFLANCAGCHSVSGDMAKVGAKYPDASVMTARFLWPTSSEAKQATITTKDGQTITGTVVSFDDFDVSVRDSVGVLHSWSRTDVHAEMPDKLTGHRALLPKYTDDELHNLTAYLVTLK